MARRRIAVFYHGGNGNDFITESDYTDFYTHLENASAKRINVEFFPILNIAQAYGKIDQLIREPENDELYLHFSGHGQHAGIPYSDLLFENAAFADLLDHYKVRFCFFSSCASAELVRLANERNIPVVLGTLKDNPIGNTFAIQFQTLFYDALLAGRTFDNAFKVARDQLKQQKKINFRDEIIIRGESHKLNAGNDLNALQMVFSASENQELRLLPQHFISEMANPKPIKPYLLAWFDDAAEAAKFRKKFYADEWSSLLHYIQIKDEELALLNRRGDPDPFALEDARLLICCSTSALLQPELREHCSSENIWSMDHYKILFAHRQQIQAVTIIGEEKLIPPSHRIPFTQVEELLANNGFLNELVEHRIPFSERRKMTLRINPKPLRNELINLPKSEMFLQAFFGRNMNEHLIDFLANYLKDLAPPTSNLVLLDNHQDPEMNYSQALVREIKRKKPNDNFFVSLVNFMNDHFIIVARNRHKDLPAWESEIKQMLELLYPAANGFKMNRPNFPCYLFFLHDTRIHSLPTQDDFLFTMQFSDPTPIDSTILEEWRNLYSREVSGPVVADELKNLVEKIPIKEYETSCPSHVIGRICDELKIPRKQVVGL